MTALIVGLGGAGLVGGQVLGALSEHGGFGHSLSGPPGNGGADVDHGEGDVVFEPLPGPFAPPAPGRAPGPP